MAGHPLDRSHRRWRRDLRSRDRQGAVARSLDPYDGTGKKCPYLFTVFRYPALAGTQAAPPPLPYGCGTDGVEQNATRGRTPAVRGIRGSVGRRSDRGRRGQATVEFAVLYAGVILPLTFMLIFVAEMLWVWHSVADLTRLGARYASTHCWQNGSENVLQWMRSHVPRMVDMDQFQNSTAELEVRYFSRDATSGSLVDFTCEGGDCTSDCVPDVVSVRVANYEFRRFSSFFGLPPIRIPDFRTSLPMESAGCDPEAATCSP